MLNALMKLQNCSVSLTTGDNGQVNLGIFKTGAGQPLALTFEIGQEHLVMEEINAYCNAASAVKITSNLDEAKAQINGKTETTPAKSKAKNAAPTQTDSADEANEEAEAESQEQGNQGNFVNDLLDEFHL